MRTETTWGQRGQKVEDHMRSERLLKNGRSCGDRDVGRLKITWDQRGQIAEGHVRVRVNLQGVGAVRGRLRYNH